MRIPGLSVLFAALVVCTSAPAQKRPTPEAALQAKLASPFLKNADWVLDFSKAKERARKRGVPILGYFTTANY